MTENRTILWSTLYEQHIVDLLGPAVDNEEEVTIEEKEDLDYIKEDCDKYRPDWMILTELEMQESKFHLTLDCMIWIETMTGLTMEANTMIVLKSWTLITFCKELEKIGG